MALVFPRDDVQHMIPVHVTGGKRIINFGASLAAYQNSKSNKATKNTNSKSQLNMLKTVARLSMVSLASMALTGHTFLFHPFPLPGYKPLYHIWTAMPPRLIPLFGAFLLLGLTTKSSYQSI